MHDGMLDPRLYVSYDPDREHYSIGLTRGNDRQWCRLRELIVSLISQGYLQSVATRVDQNGCTVFTLGSIVQRMQADEQSGHTACSFLEQWLRKQYFRRA